MKQPSSGHDTFSASCLPDKEGDFRLFPRESHLSRVELNTVILEGMMVSDMSIGCGLRRYTVQYIYETTYSLLAYIKPWGDDFVIVIQDGHIVGMVRRDKRPIWQKLRDRSRLAWQRRFPRRKRNEDAAREDVQPMADCCA